MKWRIAVVLAIAACASKKEERAGPPAWSVDPPATVAPEAEVAPEPPVVPEPPVEPAEALPAECQRLRTMAAGLGECPDLPSTAHDSVMRIYLDLERTWSTAPAGTLAGLAGRCQQAADAVATTAAACPAVAEVPPVVTGGSRTGPIERGVPLDQASLGPLAHPFGALEFLRAGMSRDEILAALPNARRDGEDKIIVPVGVENLMAQIDIDFSGHLDVVKIALPAAARDALAAAWGPPTPNDTWFDRTRRWRADLDGGELMIGPYVPVGELFGKGPDGLAETQAMIGATVAELTQRFGARIEWRDVLGDDGQPTGAHGYAVLLPATDVCKYYTTLLLELTGGHVVRATLRQCFDDDDGRLAALAAIEAKWGRVIPARGPDDRPVFTFKVPRRRVEARLVEPDERYPTWNIVITAR